MCDMSGASDVGFRLNGDDVVVRTTPDRLLIDVLREDLGRTGTKFGCGTGDCGACTVMLGGSCVNSCLIYAAECESAEVITVEGIVETDAGRRVVAAFERYGAVQCGICTPGFIVTAAAALPALGRDPQRSDVQTTLAGNLCRCTGYLPIIDAVIAVARDGTELAA